MPELAGPRILRASRAATIAPPVQRVGSAVGFGPGSVDQPGTGQLAQGTVLLATGLLRIDGGETFEQVLNSYTGPVNIVGNLHLTTGALAPGSAPVLIKVSSPDFQRDQYVQTVEIPSGGVPLNNRYRDTDQYFNVSDAASIFSVRNSTDSELFFEFLITAGGQT